MPSVCDLVHFRPLMRPHTDSFLGHCSYLNTCYSEPTYAQSPSIPPFPGSLQAQNLPSNLHMRGPVNLPSGLGAGGRGKEKAPCRYLHFEVDWDEADEHKGRVTGKSVQQSKPYRLGIGMGPYGKDMKVVGAHCTLTIIIFLHKQSLEHLASSPVDQLRCSKIRLFGIGKVSCHHGRPSMGYSYECTHAIS